MDQETLKLDFAKNMVRHANDPFKAAFATTPNAGLALQIAKAWEKDEIVIAEMEKLLSTGDTSFLPTKENQARDIYSLATSETVAVEDRLKAHRLYAEIRGFIEKPTAGATTNILNQGVMIVKDQGSDADWQEKATAHQRTLIGHATTVN